MNARFRSLHDFRSSFSGDPSEDIFYHNFMGYWMWLFYVTICFIFMNALLVGILGLAAFQLIGTFVLILQFTSSKSNIMCHQ